MAGENTEALVVLQYSLGDPDPLPETATDEEKKKWSHDVTEYAAEMLEAYKDSYWEGEGMWIEFTTTFRASSIAGIPSRLQMKWIDFLISRGVHVSRARGYPKTQSLIDCLQQEEFVPTTTPITQRETTSQHRAEEGNGNVVEYNDNSQADNNQHQIGTSSRQQMQRPFARPTDARLPNESISHQVVPGVDSVVYTSVEQRPAGLSGLMRAYTGREKFSGAFDEDLNSALELYETMSRMCYLTEEQKAKGFPVMLRDDALNYYLTTHNPEDTFAVTVDRFRNNYMTPEQKNRVLISWQTMRLSAQMRENPDSSELQVFRSMVTKLSKLQRQLEKEYRGDVFLRDQIIIASDLPAAQQSMRERVPKSSADATNRISTFLSNEAKSAGSFVTIIEEDSILYSTANRFGGDAKKNLKGSKKSRSISKWLAAHKGCFVCKKDHRARQHHTKIRGNCSY